MAIPYTIPTRSLAQVWRAVADVLRMDVAATITRTRRNLELARGFHARAAQRSACGPVNALPVEVVQTGPHGQKAKRGAEAPRPSHPTEDHTCAPVP